MQQIFKPGEAVPESATFEVVNPRGKVITTELLKLEKGQNFPAVAAPGCHYRIYKAEESHPQDVLEQYPI